MSLSDINKTTNPTLDEDMPTPDEIMEPQPSAEQDELWEKVQDSVTTEDFDREDKFCDLSIRLQDYLASHAVADQIQEISLKFTLSPNQVRGLARVIKYFFIKQWPPEDLGKALTKEVLVSSDLTEEIGKDLEPLLYPNEATLDSLTSAKLPPPEKENDAPEQPFSTKTTASSEDDTPFILHEEKPFVQSVNPDTAAPSFKIQETPSAPRKEEPVKAQVEQPKSRIVHYNNLRTPLNP